MSNDSQLEQFQKEFRESVNKKLDYLTEKIDNMPLIFANQAQFNQLKQEIEILKEFRNKTLGGLVAFNVFVTVIGWFIVHH